MGIQETIQESRRLHETNHTKDAVRVLSEALAQTPNDQLYFQRGRLFAFLNELEAADDDYSNAIKLAPSVSRYWLIRGKLRASYSYVGDAIDDLTMASFCDRTDAYPHQLLSILYLICKRRDRAFMHARKSLLLCSSDAMSWYCMGKCYFSIDNFESAAERFEKAVTLDSGSAEYWSMLALTYRKMKRLRDASKCYEEAEKFDQSAHTLIRHAEVYLDLGKPDEAIRYLDLAQAHTPADWEQTLIDFYSLLAKARKEEASESE